MLNIPTGNSTKLTVFLVGWDVPLLKVIRLFLNGGVLVSEWFWGVSALEKHAMCMSMIKNDSSI
jgi:hypothetical protein